MNFNAIEPGTCLEITCQDGTEAVLYAEEITKQTHVCTVRGFVVPCPGESIRVKLVLAYNGKKYGGDLLVYENERTQILPVLNLTVSNTYSL